MITTSTTFVLSALIMGFLVLNKMGQLAGSKFCVRLHSHEFELKLKSNLGAFWDWMVHVSMKSLRSATLNTLHKIEQFSVKMLYGVLKRVTKLTDMVSGRDIPKNRGSVSFFLKHVEDHKKKL